MSPIETYLVTGVLIPLAGFVLLAFAGRRLGKPAAGWAAVMAIAASCGLAAKALWDWTHLDAAGRLAARTGAWEWARLGDTVLAFGVNLDSLTIIMFFMVTLISTCIFVFSVGYMAGHSDEVDGVSQYHRFFAYLCLFDFSMLLLVIADSLLLLFIAWELVGLCSYLLIGYYFHKKSASTAAMKAFITNRVGDFGFLIGLGMVFLHLHDLSLAGAAAKFREAWAAGSPLFDPAAGLLGLSPATWMGMLLFCGAIGKSAQFPLHVWLPDAMEGPTPVSALIHAATMVAAGVYLTARIFVLLTPEAQLCVAVIGCLTLTLAALVAIVQTDIKKVLAYSTISQLGYMMLGMGVGAWIAALFHLLTHAFFKALMFLGSGQVIEGCHHEQDMRKMGGLWRKMPVTCATFLVGVLAIAGAGIPGAHIGIGGYFSKDEILAVAWHRAYGGEHHAEAHAAGPHADAHVVRTRAAGRPDGPRASGDAHPEARAERAGFVLVGHRARTGGAAPERPAAGASPPAEPLPSADPAAAGHRDAPGPRWLWAGLFVVPVLMAYVTPFYMMRAWWLTFMGRPRDHRVYEHAHESPLMYVPLVVLAIGTLVSSYYLFRPLVAEAAGQMSTAPFLTQLYDGTAATPAEAHGALIDHAAHHALVPAVGFAFVVGFALAIAIYGRGLALATKLAAALRPLHTLLEQKFYFDELYGRVLVGGVAALRAVLYGFDKYVVDGLVDLSGVVTRAASWFSGVILDQGLVDGLVNGVGRVTYGLGGLVRWPQVGRVRNYILFAAGGVAVVVLWVAFGRVR